MIKTINDGDYLKIVGLLALAEQNVRMFNDLEKAISSIVHVTEEDKDTSGIGDPAHIGDAVYSGESSADALLLKLGIKRTPVKGGAKP